jgi:hypothetical protein
MTQFRVCIGQFEHRSKDDGKTWVQSLRQIPARYSPVMTGEMEPARLPPGPPQCFWDYAHLSPSGFGVVVGHENVDQLRSVANLFFTTDGGGHWRQQDPKNSLGLLRRAVHSVCLNGPSWPIERFASLATAGCDCLALGWSDPGLFEDGAQSHVISTADQGATWKYHCLGDTNPYVGANNHLHVIDGPDVGDVNERHVTNLQAS